MFIEYLKRNWFGLILLKFYVLLRTSSFKMAFNFGRQDYEIIEIEDFLTSEECDKLIKMSKQKSLMVSTI